MAGEGVYNVDVFVHEDGVLRARSDEIQGLVLETTSLKELMVELHRVLARLLQSNHQLTEQELESVEVNVSVSPHTEHEPENVWAKPKRAKVWPRIRYEASPELLRLAA